MSESKQIITANNLRNGRIVYFAREADTRWPEDITQATVFDADQIETALTEARKDEQNNLVVGVYAVALDSGKLPESAREKIRAKGPSIKYGHDVA
ncbi:DUF2849 domain-containing protein [Luteithermobacter gelatinilyticus]|uniref:DUF2849 domain-containing protein n=1 Tax=Luteithermobacter gelatinilyticus TaxID=2582913 RepID=UPI00110606E2|nr:DUF2849 domain-containing protein [Luteithermobacter gelatinilyticus]|tara:strand:+ start:1762 stop:2049 length:288 start_codon:yes stop_codon:yes gene_type:complete